MSEKKPLELKEHLADKKATVKKNQELVKKNQDLLKIVKKQDKELKELKKIINDLIPTLQMAQPQNIAEITPEEIIVDTQLARLKEKAMSRSLEEGEVKMFDTLLKNKKLISEGKKPKLPEFRDVTEAELMAIALESPVDESDE